MMSGHEESGDGDGGAFIAMLELAFPPSRQASWTARAQEFRSSQRSQYLVPHLRMLCAVVYELNLVSARLGARVRWTSLNSVLAAIARHCMQWQPSTTRTRCEDGPPAKY